MTIFVKQGKTYIKAMDFILIPIGPFRPQAAQLGIPSDFDFIQCYYGRPGQTHVWNEYQVKPAVAAQVAKAP